MIRRLLISLCAMSPFDCGHSAEPSQLRFTPPDQWVRSADPASINFFAPGGSAGMIFTPSRSFAGGAGEWLDAMWNEIVSELKPASAPESGREGGFLTRTAIFEQAGGSRTWLRLYAAIQNGRGEGVVYFAASEAIFNQHRSDVDDMIRHVAPASETSPPDTPPPPVSSSSSRDDGLPASPASPRPDAGEVAGLYLARTRQIILNPLGPSGSGSWELRTEFYLLSPDGRVFRGRDLPEAPAGDIRRFDYAAAQREAPGNYGIYTVEGEKLILRVGGNETITASRPDRDTLVIRGTAFKRSSGGK